MTESAWDAIRYFKPYEFDHPDEMDFGFMITLDQIRAEAGVPMIPTSDYRPGDKKCHGTGQAIDIACHSGYARYRILKAALSHPNVRRVGVYDRHIHIDTCTASEGFPQDVVWVGKSK